MAAGYDNGDVKLFDLRTQTMRWETNVKNGVTGLEFDRNDIEMNKVRHGEVSFHSRRGFFASVVFWRVHFLLVFFLYLRLQNCTQ